MASVKSQSSDIDDMCTICQEYKQTKKSYQDVAKSLQKEIILPEFNSLSDAWKMFQGIHIFRKYLGAKIVFQIEAVPKPCTMCLVKIINLMEASYVMTRTYESGAEARKGHTTDSKRSGGLFQREWNPDLKIASQELETGGTFQETLKKAERKVERQISKHGGAKISKPPDPISSSTIQRPISSQPSNSAVSPNTPVTKLSSPPSSSPPKPAEPLESPMKTKPEKKDGKKRKHSPGAAQSEKKVKIMLPQKKTESLGSLESVERDGNGGVQQQGQESDAKKANRGRPRRDANTETPSKPIIKEKETKGNRPGLSPPSSSTPMPKSSEHLKSSLSVKKRNCSAEEGALQQETSEKIVLPQKPQKKAQESTIGGHRRDTIIKDQRSATVPSSTEIIKSSTLEELSKELRTTYVNLLDKTMRSKGLNQQMGSADSVELQVFNNSTSEDIYIQKMNKVLEFCNKTKKELSAKDEEKATSKKNIKEQNEVKEGAVDKGTVKTNNVIQDVAKGMCGSVETLQNMADLTSVDKNSRSRGSQKEKVLCTICGEQFTNKAFKTHMKKCTGSIKKSKKVPAKNLTSDSEGF